MDKTAQSGYPQQEHPPQMGFPQGGYPPQSGYPQNGYPLPQPAFIPGPTNPGNIQDSNNYDGNSTTLGEDGDLKMFDFSEKTIRRGFIRKVYAILMAQLAVTVGVVSLFTFHAPTKFWVVMNPLTMWVALIAMIVCLVAMACCDDVRRTAPMNFIFLGVFTVAQSFLLGVITAQFNSMEVLLAVGLTAAIALSLTLFAMQTKFDFTVMGGMLICLLVVLSLFGLILIFIPKNNILSLVYGSAGALLFSVYLVYDTQLMMGGNHKYTISPEEYVFAALNLYLDIINILLYILRIIAASRG